MSGDLTVLMLTCDPFGARLERRSNRLPKRGVAGKTRRNLPRPHPDYAPFRQRVRKPMRNTHSERRRSQCKPKRHTRLQPRCKHSPNKRWRYRLKLHKPKRHKQRQHMRPRRKQLHVQHAPVGEPRAAHDVQRNWMKLRGCLRSRWGRTGRQPLLEPQRLQLRGRQQP